MIALGYILFLTGLIAWAIGGNMFLAVVFRYSTAWFFGCAFLPFTNWVYFFLYMKQTWRPMLIGTLGCMATLIGCWIIAVFGS
jgi:hypothetical protein